MGPMPAIFLKNEPAIQHHPIVRGKINGMVIKNVLPTPHKNLCPINKLAIPPQPQKTQPIAIRNIAGSFSFHNDNGRWLLCENGKPYSGIKGVLLYDKGKIYSGLKDNLLYRNGKKLTGWNNSDGQWQFYKNGKRYYKLIPAIGEKLYVMQRSIGDCDVLASLISVFSDPCNYEKANKLCSVNSSGELTLELSSAIKALPNLITVLDDAQNKNVLAQKGYTINLDKSKKTFTVTITTGKLLSILDEQRRLGSTETNSVFVSIMEHLVGNVRLLLNQNEIGNGNNINSLMAHSAQKNSSHVYRLISALFQNSEYTVYPLNMRDVSSICEYFDTQKIGAAFHQSTGYVVVCFDGHARALRKVVRNERGEITRLELINPHNSDAIEIMSIETIQRALNNKNHANKFRITKIKTRNGVVVSKMVEEVPVTGLRFAVFLPEGIKLPSDRGLTIA